MCIVVFRRMQTVTNLYISALALSDVVLAMFCIPFQVSSDWSTPALFTSHWFSAVPRGAAAALGPARDHVSVLPLHADSIGRPSRKE